MAVTSCYNKLWFKEQEMPFQLCFDMASDIGWDRNGSSLTALGNGAHDSNNGTALNLWTNLYQGVALCNYVINNMYRCKDVVDEALYNQRRSEARFLRALYYHYLIELFGGVPLVTTSLTLSDSQLPKNTKEEIVSFILTELDECAPFLPEKNDPVLGRATREAAWALASRVALYNQRWSTAISSALKVMAYEGTQVEMSKNYMNLFQYAGESSKEILFSIQYLKGSSVHPLFRLFGSRNANAHTNKIPAYQLTDAWECIDGLQIDESPLFDPQHPYKNRDPRLGYTLAVSGSTFLGFQFETHGDSVKCWNYNASPAARVDNKEATHAYATFSGVCWRKYADNLDKSAVNESELNTIIIRYAEVLLNYAEAKIEDGSIDQSVLDAINKVRQRESVNMPPITTFDQKELRNAVRRERKYELAGEGLRLFDIRRWKIAEEVMKLPVLGRMKKSYPSKAPVVDQNGTAFYTDIPVASSGESSDFKMRTVEIRNFDKDRDYLWPIPRVETQANHKLEQNPKY
jgi:hypothetical protein